MTAASGKMAEGYAGFWLRLLAYIVDGFVLYLPCSIFRWLFEGVGLQAWLLNLLDWLYVCVINTLYYGLLESSKYQGTVGKIILGLKVTDMDGRRISFARACGRFLAQGVSAILLGIGFLMIAWTRRKQGLHDMIARCLVVRTWGPPRPAEKEGVGLRERLKKEAKTIRKRFG